VRTSRKAGGDSGRSRPVGWCGRWSSWSRSGGELTVVLTIRLQNPVYRVVDRPYRAASRSFPRRGRATDRARVDCRRSLNRSKHGDSRPACWVKEDGSRRAMLVIARLHNKLSAVDRSPGPGVTVPQGADVVGIGEMPTGVSLAACIAKPAGSRRFDPMRFSPWCCSRSEAGPPGRPPTRSRPNPACRRTRRSREPRNRGPSSH
jgi:hypothetical protein